MEHLLYPVNVVNPRTGKTVTFDPQPVADLPQYAQDVVLNHPEYLGSEPNNPQE